MKIFTKIFFASALIIVYCSGYGANLKFNVNNGGTYIPETPVINSGNLTNKHSYELLSGYKSNLNLSGLSKSISKTLNKPQRFRYDFTASTATSLLGVNLMSTVRTKWDQENLKPTLTARPNPATNMVTISLEQASDAEYRILLQNTIGKEIKTIKVPESAHNKDFKIDLSAYAPGIYFYSLFSDGKLVMTKRLVKQQ